LDKLTEQQQEEITREGDEAEEEVSERLSPVKPPLPVKGEGDLHHRLGYTEAVLSSQMEVLQQHKTISEQQAAEIARLRSQTEIQESELMKLKATEQVQRKQPGFLEKLLGGHNRS
jgi:hypothetical protein